MCDKAYERQCQAQDAFWTCTINKYYDKIDSLKKEKQLLEDIVNGLQVSLPAVFTFNVNKLAKKNAGANLDSLFTPKVPKPNLESKRYIKKPDLKNISVFDMTDQDINSLNIIKHLIEDEQSLVDNINSIAKREQELLKSKSKIDRLQQQSQANLLVNLDAKHLEKFYKNLIKDNKSLLEELNDIENELEELKSTETNMLESLKNIKGEEDAINCELKKGDNDENGDDSPSKSKLTVKNLKDALKMNSERLKEETKNNCLLKCELARIRHVVSQLEKDVTKKILELIELKQK